VRQEVKKPRLNLLRAKCSHQQREFATLVKRIGANAVIAPSEWLDTLMKQMNSLIEKFNTLLAMRSGRKGGEQPQDDTPKEEE
jgi:hypothetical protein